MRGSIRRGSRRKRGSDRKRFRDRRKRGGHGRKHRHRLRKKRDREWLRRCEGSRRGRREKNRKGLLRLKDRGGC